MMIRNYPILLRSGLTGRPGLVRAGRGRIGPASVDEAKRHYHSTEYTAVVKRKFVGREQRQQLSGNNREAQAVACAPNLNPLQIGTSILRADLFVS